MITLHTFGPAFGLPDPSPFVTKADALLRMSGLPYRTKPGGRGGPKGKRPFIDDGDERIADSTFIRWHLETKHGIDFDRGLSAEERAVAWAFEKMAEEHLYWALVSVRWMDDANFDRGPRDFFKMVPAPLRPLVIAMVRRQVRKSLWAQGLGRHTPTELTRLATRSIDAIAAHLGAKPFFMGDTPTGVDATLLAFVAATLCPTFTSPIRAAAERHDNLVRYVGRMTARYYPEMTDIAGCKAAA